MVFHYHAFTFANFMTEPSCNLPVCWIGCVVGQGAAQGKGACANRQPTLELVASRPTHCSQAWPATPDTHTHTQIHKKHTVPGSGQVRSWEMRSRRQHRMATDIKVRTTQSHVQTHAQAPTWWATSNTFHSMHSIVGKCHCALQWWVPEYPNGLQTNLHTNKATTIRRK